MNFDEACKLAEKGYRVTRVGLPRNTILKGKHPFDVLDLGGIYAVVKYEDRTADDWIISKI